jgi:hypothetical protein
VPNLNPDKESFHKLGRLPERLAHDPEFTPCGVIESPQTGGLIAVYPDASEQGTVSPMIGNCDDRSLIPQSLLSHRIFTRSQQLAVHWRWNRSTVTSTTSVSRD